MKFSTASAVRPPGRCPPVAAMGFPLQARYAGGGDGRNYQAPQTVGQVEIRSARLVISMTSTMSVSPIPALCDIGERERRFAGHVGDAQAAAAFQDGEQFGQDILCP